MSRFVVDITELRSVEVEAKDAVEAAQIVRNMRNGSGHCFNRELTWVTNLTEAL